MKKEEKVVEVLREEGYKVSEEDVLIAQSVSFFNFIPKQFFLAYNDKQFFIIGATLIKGDPDKNKRFKIYINNILFNYSCIF